MSVTIFPFIVQIAVSGGGDNSSEVLYALANDGSIYRRVEDRSNSKWEEIRLPRGVFPRDDEDEARAQAEAKAEEAAAEAETETNE